MNGRGSSAGAACARGNHGRDEDTRIAGTTLWGFVAHEEMPELCERVVNIFVTNESDHKGLGSRLVQIGMGVKQRLTPMNVDASRPLSK